MLTRIGRVGVGGHEAGTVAHGGRGPVQPVEVELAVEAADDRGHRRVELAIVGDGLVARGQQGLLDARPGTHEHSGAGRKIRGEQRCRGLRARQHVVGSGRHAHPGEPGHHRGGRVARVVGQEADAPARGPQRRDRLGRTRDRGLAPPQHAVEVAHDHRVQRASVLFLVMAGRRATIAGPVPPPSGPEDRRPCPSSDRSAGSATPPTISTR